MEATHVDNMNILFEILFSFVGLLKTNSNWDTYFKSTMPSFEIKSKTNLETLINYTFNYEERVAWLKYLPRNGVQEKVAEESKQRYIDAHKIQFKEPAPQIDENP